jgi:hypothetical protein
MKPLAWSHSALNDFITCPKAYFHKRIAKDVQDVPGEAATWGDRVHKAFEAYLKGVSSAEVEIRLDPELEIYKGYLDEIAARPGVMYIEQQLAINKQMEPCGWFDKDVWMRGIIDVLHVDGDTGTVLDHKTGKPKNDPRQLKLFALLVFIHHPEVQVCNSEFQWLKFGTTDSARYLRSQEAELWQEMLPDLLRYRTAFKLEVFNPRPSGLCNGWCPVKQCQHWKPKRN